MAKGKVTEKEQEERPILKGKSREKRTQNWSKLSDDLAPGNLNRKDKGKGNGPSTSKEQLK